MYVPLCQRLNIERIWPLRKIRRLQVCKNDTLLWAHPQSVYKQYRRQLRSVGASGPWKTASSTSMMLLLLFCWESCMWAENTCFWTRAHSARVQAATQPYAIDLHCRDIHAGMLFLCEKNTKRIRRHESSVWLVVSAFSICSFHSRLSSDSRGDFCNSGWHPSTSSRALVSACDACDADDVCSIESGVSESSLLLEKLRTNGVFAGNGSCLHSQDGMVMLMISLRCSCV